MSLSEKIKSSLAELNSKKDELLDLTKALEATPESEEILAQVEELTGVVKSKSATLSALENAEQALKDRAKAVIEAPAVIHGRKAKGSDQPLFVKNAVCSFLAHTQRKSVDQVMSERYANDDQLKMVRDVQKSTVPLATTFDAGWAAELVQEDVQGFIDLLTPLSVAAALSTRGTVLNFGGFDSISIPHRAARTGNPGEDLASSFVGEGGAIPLGKMSVGATKLNRFKMGVISTFSKELAERSTPAIEGLIRNAILDDTSMALDGAFMSAGAEVTGVQPAGILNGVTIGTADTTGGVASVIADIKTMLGALTAAGYGSRPVLVMNSQDALSLGLMQTALGEFVFRDSLASGSLLGVEVVKSLNVPKGTTFMIDADCLATAFDSTEFDVSDVATVVEANSNLTAPTMALATNGAVGSTAAQVGRNNGISVADPRDPTTALGTVGAQARSLWQTHSIGIKSVSKVSWGLMRPGCVTGLNTLNW